MVFGCCVVFCASINVLGDVSMQALRTTGVGVVVSCGTHVVGLRCMQADSDIEPPTLPPRCVE